MEERAARSPLSDNGQVWGVGASPHEHDDIRVLQPLAHLHLCSELLQQFPECSSMTLMASSRKHQNIYDNPPYLQSDEGQIEF